MLFKNITLINENFEVLKNMFVGTKNDRIAYIGAEMPKEDFGETYNGEKKLMLPAFHNAHSHLPMFLLRGYGENLPLQDWLNTRIFPFEAKIGDNDMYYGTLMGVAEMLRYGIGSTREMYLSHPALCKAFSETGVRATLSRCAMCFDNSSYNGSRIQKETLEAIRDYNGYDNGRVKVEFSLHAEYTSNESFAKEIAEFAAENNSSMHIHIAETASETEECKARHGGRTPVEYLADCGIFSVPTNAAHCVHLTDNDIEILKQYNVTVATCPKGNAKLSSGICPVTKLLKAGVNVAIGTDSVASNNNLNMLEEMRFFNLLQKANTLDPTAISPKETLFAASRAGAISTGLTDGGFIKEGFKADITVLDIDRVYMQPEYDLLSNLIFSASGSDVVLTMVDGKILYKNGEYTTIDIEKAAFECNKICNRVTNELK